MHGFLFLCSQMTWPAGICLDSFLSPRSKQDNRSQSDLLRLEVAWSVVSANSRNQSCPFPLSFQLVATRDEHLPKECQACFDNSLLNRK